MNFDLDILFGSIIAPIIVIVLVYLWNHFFRGVDLNGEWIAIIKVRESSYHTYVKLTAEFRFHLLRDGNKITGTGEKISNSNHDGPDTVYEHAKRPTVKIDGIYKNRIFAKHQLILNIVENGAKRESRTTYHLLLTSKNFFSGDFESTAANSRGEANLKVSRTYFKKA